MNQIRKQLREQLTVTPENAHGQTFRAAMALPPEFAGFRGHFPGSPVLPGVCLLASVILAAEVSLRKPLRITQIRSAKFFSPVGPNERIEIRGSVNAKQTPHAVKGDVVCGDRKVAKVLLFAQPAGDDD